MRLWLVCCLVFTCTTFTIGKDKENTIDDKAPVKLSQLVVTATRTERDAYHTPNTINLITSKDIHERLLSRSVPESLKYTPGVLVQKTAHGHGSPYIRGFTSFRTLFLIDGIRLNNSVFRPGPNQYWNTVDPSSINRIEVVKGAGSVLYGSDAIGGTVNAVTRSAVSYKQGLDWSPALSYRFASAEQSHTGRAEIEFTKDNRFGLLAGGVFKDYGDMDGGRNIGRQPNTGYHEWDADFKMDYRITSDSTITLCHQTVNQEDIWRTHKTIYAQSWAGTAVGNEKKRVFDQNRHLTYIQFHDKELTSFLNNFKVSLSHQLHDEERSRIKKDDKGDVQGFDVNTLGFWIQAGTETSFGNWTYGIDYYHDFVDTYKRSYNADGSLKSTAIQGPVADDSTYTTFGIFVQNEIQVMDRLELIPGLRYTYIHADAGKFEDPNTGNEESLSESYNAFTGSLRLRYQIDEAGKWNVFAGVSQGFRAPNLSDLTRLDSARSNEIETPSPDLDPEKYITSEIGLKTSHELVRAQAVYFYTIIDDQITRTPTGNVIGGDDEVTKRNSGDGYVHGIELNAAYDFYPSFTLFGALTWIYGEVDTYPTSNADKKRYALTRLMPPTAHLGVRWANPDSRTWVEFSSDMAADADKLSNSDERDTQRIPPEGTPGYALFNLRGGWNFRKGMTLTAAVENMFNKDYRYHGSGQNEPGTNFMAGLTLKF